MQTATDRPITAEESAVIQWLLDHAAVGDVAEYRRRPVEELRVVGECDCGCPSLFFSAELRHIGRIADAMAVLYQTDLLLWPWGL